MSDQVFEYHPVAIQEAWDAFHWYDERSEMRPKTFGKSYGVLVNR